MHYFVFLGIIAGIILFEIIVLKSFSSIAKKSYLLTLKRQPAVI